MMGSAYWRDIWRAGILLIAFGAIGYGVTHLKVVPTPSPMATAPSYTFSDKSVGGALAWGGTVTFQNPEPLLVIHFQDDALPCHPVPKIELWPSRVKFQGHVDDAAVRFWEAVRIAFPKWTEDRSTYRGARPRAEAPSS